MVLFASCNRSVKYNQYAHTSVVGWEKNDVLSFDVPPLEQDGEYARQLGLRITSAYPFMSLSLIVDTKKWSAGTVPSDYTQSRDTLQCELINNEGRSLGQGIGSYQYTFSLPTVHYAAGDSLHIEVRHDMKREILPGISDVGVKLLCPLHISSSINSQEDK